jgi:hypothetical protein
MFLLTPSTRNDFAAGDIESDRSLLSTRYGHCLSRRVESVDARGA